MSTLEPGVRLGRLEIIELLPGLGLFAEGRYEFLAETVEPSPDLRQWMLRAGLVVRWGGLPL